MAIAFWFRRDLRLHDNAGLYRALKQAQQSGEAVIPVFIFDRNILNSLPADDARVTFIHRTISELQQQLVALGGSLVVRYGSPDTIWPALVAEFGLSAVFTNHDYEPYARTRDAHIREMLWEQGVTFATFKDQVIFEKDEVLSQQGKPYSVFTPYSRAWRAKLNSFYLKSYPTTTYLSYIQKMPALPLPTLAEMGFQESSLAFPSPTPSEAVIRQYSEQRDFPAIAGVTRMGIHLRFGTVSIRELVRQAMKLNDSYVNELIWREFYQQILWNFPHVADRPFRLEYEAVPWNANPDNPDFARWCEGKTGYPLVDAGMRELNATGYMHNRVRMVVASFLTKHLLIHYRLGEAYFAEKLLDFDLASNSGGWQWAAGCGCDAAPYFRVFNPASQTEKFDPKLAYIRRWVPEYGTPAYPRPMVDHAHARERAIAAYKMALSQK